MQKDAKQYLFFMLDDISRALSSGREVRLQGIGTIKRVCFRSRTMANPNDRSQQLLVLDRYYPHVKASPQLKLKLKARMFPDRYCVPTPKYRPLDRASGRRPPKPAEGAQLVPIKQSHSIRINVSPKIPKISWRAPMSGLVLDLRARQARPETRLLRNLLRRASGDSVHGVTLAPYDITAYGARNSRDEVDPKLYDLTIKALRQYLPAAFLNPQTWRLLTNLPSDDSTGTRRAEPLGGARQMFNFSALPSSDDNWLIAVARPRAQHETNKLTSSSLPEHSKKQINDILSQGAGNIAVIGPHSGRHATFEQIRRLLQNQNIGHHYCVEHHHHQLHPHFTLGPSLRQLSDEVGTYRVTLIDGLSGADNFLHLRRLPGVTISNIAAPDKNYFDRLLRLQRVPPQFFSTIIEGHALPAACSQCMATHEPAVRFPLMRKLAGKRGELLHVHPVRITAGCDHEPEYHLVNIVYSANDASASLDEQLYRLALDHKISYNTLEKQLSPLSF